MSRNNTNGRGAASARGFMALFAIMLAIGLALAASPAEAAPFAYVTTGGFDGAGGVSVIDTATHPPSVVVTVPVGTFPQGVAVTPDGKHVYVANFNSNNVSVVETATNAVVATTAFPVGTFPINVAVIPDGKHAYVTNGNPNINGVSVIRTATNTVVATVPVSSNALVAIVPPPPGVPFLAFSATALDIDFDGSGSPIFNLHSQFTLSSTAPAINPVTQPVTLQVGTFSTTFPPGSFAKQLDGSFTFAGVIDGVRLKAQIRPAATLQYTFHAKATAGASLKGTKNEVYVTLIIGGDSGATSVTAAISP